MQLQGWWESLDYLDEGKVEEKRKREAAIEAAKMKDPDLVQEGDEEEEADDIFGDFETEERKKVRVMVTVPTLMLMLMLSRGSVYCSTYSS